MGVVCGALFLFRSARVATLATPSALTRHCLAAARSRRGSDMPPACHSLPRRRFATLEGAALRGKDSALAPLLGAPLHFSPPPHYSSRFHAAGRAEFTRLQVPNPRSEAGFVASGVQNTAPTGHACSAALRPPISTRQPSGSPRGGCGTGRRSPCRARGARR